MSLPELDLANCGTERQYRAHRRRGQHCQRCRDAASRVEYDRRARRKDRVSA